MSICDAFFHISRIHSLVTLSFIHSLVFFYATSKEHTVSIESNTVVPKCRDTDELPLAIQICICVCGKFMA
jgi:hypothetical protein